MRRMGELGEERGILRPFCKWLAISNLRRSRNAESKPEMVSGNWQVTCLFCAGVRLLPPGRASSLWDQYGVDGSLR